LYANTQAAPTPTIKLRAKESSMDTLWQEKEFDQVYRRESLTEKVAEIEITI